MNPLPLTPLFSENWSENWYLCFMFNSNSNSSSIKCVFFFVDLLLILIKLFKWWSEGLKGFLQTIQLTHALLIYMVTGYFQVNYIVSVTPTYNTQPPPVFPNGNPTPHLSVWEFSQDPHIKILQKNISQVLIVHHNAWKEIHYAIWIAAEILTKHAHIWN